MIKVIETVYNEGEEPKVIEQEWKLKSAFINQLKALPQVSNFVICDLQKTNTCEFMIDGVRRTIQIEPKIYLGAENA